MKQKLIASILAILLTAGSITTNLLAFSAFASALNLRTPFIFSPSQGLPNQNTEVQEPSPVDTRNLGVGVVPDLVGVTYSDAKKLEALSGYHFTFYVVNRSGLLTPIPTEVQNPGGLFVCKQALPGGAEIDPKDTPFQVEVVVSAQCKNHKNDYLVGKAKFNPSAWEPIRPTDETKNVVQGWVYGFSGEDENQKLVQIMTYYGVKEFELAMIDLAGTGGCDLSESDWATYIQQALDSKHSHLPIGAPVSAVLDWMETNENEAFLHLLEPATGNYLVEPPRDSVNESLVSEGYWVPDDQHILLGPEYVAEVKQKWVPTDGYVDLTKLGREYRKLILEAGNTKRKNPQAVVGNCISYWTKLFVDAEGGVDVRWKYGITGGYVPPGCTYVNGYWRRNGYVRGYFRCG